MSRGSSHTSLRSSDTSRTRVESHTKSGTLFGRGFLPSALIVSVRLTPSFLSLDQSTLRSGRCLGGRGDCGFSLPLVSLETPFGLYPVTPASCVYPYTSVLSFRSPPRRSLLGPSLGAREGEGGTGNGQPRLPSSVGGICLFYSGRTGPTPPFFLLRSLGRDSRSLHVG